MSAGGGRCRSLAPTAGGKEAALGLGLTPPSTQGSPRSCSAVHLPTFNGKRLPYGEQLAVGVDGHLVVQQGLIHDEGVELGGFRPASMQGVQGGTAPLGWGCADRGEQEGRPLPTPPPPCS